MLNKCMFIGNLGADAELRSIASGDTVLKFRIAVTEKWKDKAGNKQEKTEWISCNLWGKRAEALSQYMTKGQRVYVEGSYQTREYEKDGQKRFATDIKVRDVILLGDRRGSGEQPEPKTSSKPGGSYDEADYGGGGDDDLPF